MTKHGNVELSRDSGLFKREVTITFFIVDVVTAMIAIQLG